MTDKRPESPESAVIVDHDERNLHMGIARDWHEKALAQRAAGNSYQFEMLTALYHQNAAILIGQNRLIGMNLVMSDQLDFIADVHTDHSEPEED